MPVYSISNNDRRLNILSVHIPKTGGTAIAGFLKNTGFSEHFGTEHRAIRPALVCPPQHYDYDLLSRLVKLERMDCCFAIVRNPISKLISDYKWSTTKTGMKAWNLTFDEWVRYCFSEFQSNEYFLANHIKPQFRYVGPKISRVFKYEDGLSSIMAEVFNHCNFTPEKPMEIPIVNRSDPTEVQVGSATEMIIRNFYAKDFEIFGYE